MTKQHVSEETIRRIQAERHRVLDALTKGVQPYHHSPEKLAAVKCGDLATLTEWLREYIDREQHGGLITKP